MERTIKDAAKQVGLTVHTIRYYEQEGLLPSIQRNEHGNRLFSDEDIEWLELIVCMRDTGMPIADLKRVTDLSREGDHTISERKRILKQHRQAMERKMEEIKRAFEIIDHKINWYESLEHKHEAHDK